MIVEKIKIDLGSIQETLLVPLMARAKELDKNNPLIIDWYAKEIVSKIDYDFSMIESVMEDNHQIVWIIRALNFDNDIKQFLLNNKDVLIVNIGAGLDTTFQRVDNGRVFWINLDLPDVIDLRHKLIPDTDREISLAKSIFDYTWFKEIDQYAKDRIILFIAAGVFCYFKKSDLQVLFKELSKTYSNSYLYFDAMSWLTVWGANRSIMKKSGIDSSALLKWYLKRPLKLKKWVNSIKILNKYPMFSKLPTNTDISKKVLRDMKIADFLGMYKMVHIRF